MPSLRRLPRNDPAEVAVERQNIDGHEAVGLRLHDDVAAVGDEIDLERVRPGDEAQRLGDEDVLEHEPLVHHDRPRRQVQLAPMRVDDEERRGRPDPGPPAATGRAARGRRAAARHRSASPGNSARGFVGSRSRAGRSPPPPTGSCRRRVPSHGLRAGRRCLRRRRRGSRAQRLRRRSRPSCEVGGYRRRPCSASSFWRAPSCSSTCSSSPRSRRCCRTTPTRSGSGRPVPVCSRPRTRRVCSSARSPAALSRHGSVSSRRW